MPEGPPALTSPPTAPPLQPDTQPASHPPQWPTIVGWIAVVLGGLSALGGIYGMFSPLLVEWFARHMPGSTMQSLQAVQVNQAWTVTYSMGTAMLGALLVASGYGLTRRRRWSVGAARTWAALKIALTLLGTVFGGMAGLAQVDATLQQDPQLAATLSPEMFKIMVWAGSCMGLLWGWAFAGFLLVWLSRRRVRADFAEWS